MQQTVATSALLKYRADTVVPSRVSAIKQAIIEKDFQTFATLTMQDSNQFHAVCLDTFPPCVYMNDISHVIVEMVHAYNEFYKTNKVRKLLTIYFGFYIYQVFINIIRLHIHLMLDQMPVYLCKKMMYQNSLL